MPNGRVVQVDIDPAELHKGHPAVDLRIAADADSCLRAIVETARAEAWRERWTEWRAFGRSTLDLLPLAEDVNTPSTGPGFLDPYRFVGELSDVLDSTDLIVPASSGGAFTVMMQAFRQKRGQLIVSDKGLASMGYGLSGAIGVAVANPSRRVIHVEGDGGFAQNVQELGTVAAQRLNIKTFLLHNEGYASIRMTQRNYFGGAYLGCDTATGLGLPDWVTLFRAYGIPCSAIDPENAFGPETLEALGSDGPHAFLVPLDPEQTYFPEDHEPCPRRRRYGVQPLASDEPGRGGRCRLAGLQVRVERVAEDTVNQTERKMTELLKIGKESYGVVSVKAEFEAEGTRMEELLRLVDVARAAQLPLTVKVGGCEAVRDLLEAKQVGVSYIVAPMVETPYALSKYIAAKNTVYLEEEREDTDFLFNIETITAYENLEAIVELASETGGVEGIVFGRVDFSARWVSIETASTSSASRTTSSTSRGPARTAVSTSSSAAGSRWMRSRHFSKLRRFT